MTESEGEIEFLDEDADIVQQCVQTANQNIPIITKTSPETRQLLIERIPKKKKQKIDDSSDYDPSEDLKLPKKRKAQVQPKYTSKTQPSRVILKHNPITPKSLLKDPLRQRRKLDIKVPDYEDPLCLPVKLMKRDENDVKKLKNWNNLCLDHLKNCDDSLKPKTGTTVSSKRTVVLRNVKHNITGKIEMTVWSKTSVENMEGDKKSEVFQCILPKYRERSMLEYSLPPVKKKKDTRQVSTVLLTKEDHKEGQMLVVYSPTEAVSAVYRLVDVPDNEEDTDEKAESPPPQRFLQELSSCKVCAPCYQSSWRPTRAKGENKDISCVICSRTFTSVYNFLSHARTHSAAQISKHRRTISLTLAKMVDYHYKCRMCQRSLSSIKELRKHVVTHISKEEFLCEIGNHVTQ